MTAEEFLYVDVPGKRTELVRGRLVVRDLVGIGHGATTARITVAIGIWLAQHPIGFVLAGDPGFVLERGPDTVRGPDVAFVRSDRGLSANHPGFAELAPDLAIEVRSPGDRAGELDEKIDQWLAAGTRLVWVIEPAQRRARVVRPDGSRATLCETDALDGDDVMPGFTLNVGDVV